MASPQIMRERGVSRLSRLRAAAAVADTGASRIPPTESAPVNSRIYDLNNADPLVILEKIRRTVDVVAWQNERILGEFRSLYWMLSNRTDAIESVAAMTESKVELLNDKFDLLLDILAPGNRLRLELTDSTPPQAASQP